jgi:hypothetical protein
MSHRATKTEEKLRRAQLSPTTSQESVPKTPPASKPLLLLASMNLMQTRTRRPSLRLFCASPETVDPE